MSEMERREALLKQDGYIIGIASLSLLNGMHFSPYFSFVAIPFGPILREYGITSPVITFYLAHGTPAERFHLDGRVARCHFPHHPSKPDGACERQRLSLRQRMALRPRCRYRFCMTGLSAGLLPTGGG
jgi:hypothetical protein